MQGVLAARMLEEAEKWVDGSFHEGPVREHMLEVRKTVYLWKQAVAPETPTGQRFLVTEPAIERVIRIVELAHQDALSQLTRLEELKKLVERLRKVLK